MSPVPSIASQGYGLVLSLSGYVMQAQAARLRQNFLRREYKRQYGTRGEYRKWALADDIEELLEDFKIREFKANLRMNRVSFERILHLIKDDNVFKSKGRKPQLPVHYQLAVYLMRYGTSIASKVSSQVKIGEGSVYKCCKRVTHAIRKLRPIYLRWPTEQEKKVLKLEYQEDGFPGAIGAIDGTYIQLLDKPRVRPMAYLCRKKFWALNMMAIVDSNGRFISYDLGWPGTIPDVSVWKRSHVWRHRDSYLSKHEWLFGDKGYPLTRYMITPFQEHEIREAPNARSGRLMKKWNKAMSSQRIVVEHTFARLKQRFRYLQGVRGSNLNTIYRAIESFLVLHNICIELGDFTEDLGPAEAAHIIHTAAEARSRVEEGDFEALGLAENAESAGRALLIGQRRRQFLVDHWAAKKGF